MTWLLRGCPTCGGDAATDPLEPDWFTCLLCSRSWRNPNVRTIRPLERVLAEESVMTESEVYCRNGHLQTAETRKEWIGEDGVVHRRCRACKTAWNRARSRQGIGV